MSKKGVKKTAPINWQEVGPELLEAAKYALGLVSLARQYFPKSIKNSDTFRLENTCAALGTAIAKAEGKI